MYSPRRPALLLLAALSLLSFCGCATFSVKTEPMRLAYARGDYALAETDVDRLLTEEAGASGKSKKGAVDAAKGDNALFLLEKGTIRLARNDPESAVRYLRQARDVLDANFVYDTGSFIRDIASMLVDDTIRKYPGADYEHILVRSMLALTDLMAGGGDAFAYAVQVGEKQEEIIGSPLGELRGEKGLPKPREHYRRVGFGAYLQGVIREDKLIFDEAERAYERALSFERGSNAVYSEAVDRIRNPRLSIGPTGVLHVFDLAGTGPYLAETRENPTAEAIRLATIILGAMNNKVAFIVQAPIPVPKVAVSDPYPPPLWVQVNGKDIQTATVLDVNLIAREQLDANMPWIMARALARRAVKGIASQKVGRVAASGVRGGETKELVQDLTTIAASIVSTAIENADTRSWSTLPAQIRTARVELPEGVQHVYLGSAGWVDVRIAAGHASYVLVVRPGRGAANAVVVDRYSKP